ncbi:hypothetical protein SAMN04488523_12513 [Sulfitobacter brevis]|uniref:Uncharacterized protein n=1 Tax=Sulfitobacter brevis TaxID=74348 RepID=A0A1I2GJJ2_9RHOB|nr:hypothetical protein [Sulfitobacter brevis]SFF17199.1 hypothetical protein SAMN04488523_12513 [Sulfitobacter brevis]
MIPIAKIFKVSRDTSSEIGRAAQASDDKIAARKAAKAYQSCVIAGFALPAIALLIFAFM